MKKLKIVCFKWVTPALLFGINMGAFAQSPASSGLTHSTPPAIMIPDEAKKLPNIQPTGLLAPSNVNIDGKAAEWDDKFMAYNRATDVFYTIANDNNNLYFIIRAVDPGVINRITSMGAQLMLNTSGKKNDKEAIVITYPAYSKSDRPVINLANIPKAIEMRADSFTNANNKRFVDKATTIKITGVPGLDTLSIYNQAGIKAAALFNNKTQYTCELAIPLKLLGVSFNQPIKIAYNLTVKGIKLEDVPGVVVTTRPNGMKSWSVPAGATSDDRPLTSSPTDFWGEYTLTK